MVVFVDEQVELPDKWDACRFHSKWSVSVPNLMVQASIALIIVISVQQT